MKKFLLISFFILNSNAAFTQVKILFDATKAQTAGQADWIIDADQWNLNWNPNAYTGTNNWHSNPQRIPTNSQANITASTSETYWTGGLSAWGVDCAKKGYIVESLPFNGQITYGNSTNPQDLSNYKVFVVCEPNILFTTSEKTALIQYVQNGGGLFLVADHTISDRNGDNYDSPDILNDLFNNNSVKNNPFGISVDLQDFSGISNNISAAAGDSIIYGPMGSVTQVKWASGTSFTISPTANSTVKAVVYKSGTTSGNNNVLFAYARFGKGKVCVIGDSSPCDDGTGNPSNNITLYNGYFTDAGGNHQKLIMNATIWLATGSMTPPVKATISTTNTAVFCSGDSATLISNTGTGYTYQWKLNGQNITGATQNSYVAKSAGTYTIAINDTAISNSITITVYPLPMVSISAMPSSNLCMGDTSILTITGNGTFYQWKKDGNNIIGATTSSYKSTLSGAYAVAASLNSCTNTSNSINLVFNNKPPKPTISKTGTTSNGFILSTDANTSYQWLLNNTPLNGKIKQLDTATVSGNYRVIVYNASGCKDTSNIFLVDLSKGAIQQNKEDLPFVLLQKTGATFEWTLVTRKQIKHLYIQIFDIAGHEILHKRYINLSENQEITIDTQKGFYLGNLEVDGEVYTSKWMVE